MILVMTTATYTPARANEPKCTVKITLELLRCGNEKQLAVGNYLASRSHDGNAGIANRFSVTCR